MNSWNSHDIEFFNWSFNLNTHTGWNPVLLNPRKNFVPYIVILLNNFFQLIKYAGLYITSMNTYHWGGNSHLSWTEEIAKHYLVFNSQLASKPQFNRIAEASSPTQRQR